MPQLVQFGDLTPEHFARHPVWASCHSFDYDEPWYDDTDEETFRPWTGQLPARAGDGLYLIQAEFILADGTRLSGFLTPAAASETVPGALGRVQPQIFLASGQRVEFWLGMFGDAREVATSLYAALGKSADAVFPIRFGASTALATGSISGELLGFYTIPDGRTVTIAK